MISELRKKINTVADNFKEAEARQETWKTSTEQRGSE
jgi:hypothetical protein